MAVVVGLQNLYYALLTADTTGSATTYGTPVAIPGAIEVNVKPTYAAETLYADNGPFEVASALSDIDVELNAADLPLDIQAALLGHTVNAGVLVRKASDSSPYVAIGFKALKSNGKFRFIWLYKGKFDLPEMNHKTKEDKVEYQTSKITGKFVQRVYDGAWMKVGDEDATGWVATTGTNWFTSVT